MHKPFDSAEEIEATFAEITGPYDALTKKQRRRVAAVLAAREGLVGLSPHISSSAGIRSTMLNPHGREVASFDLVYVASYIESGWPAEDPALIAADEVPYEEVTPHGLG